MRQHKQSNAKTLWGGVIFWPLFLLAVTPLVLTTPAHATDDNTVSIAVDQNAALKPSGNLYKATTNVTVKTDKPYGFNLVMQTATGSSDLINSNNSTRHIYGVNYYNMATELSANQWGYAFNKQTNKFARVPSHNDTPAVIADVTKSKPAGCTNPANCTKSVTFAANVDPAKLASGSYSTAITYTATAKPRPVQAKWTVRTAKTNPSELCQSGNANSSCLIDLDPNMIPVKYTGTTTNAQWTSVANPEAVNSGWYDYANKQWANAVTVKPEALAKYRGFSKVVDQADILGFWVYIPRYTYEVMRRDGTDKPVKEQNFDIKFENAKTPKKRPLACKTGNGKDYRTECGVSRELPLTGGEVSTWTTHPAFTFGTKELNGIWLAKFETTGTAGQPTVLPNEAHISGKYRGINSIGNLYSVAKSLGVNDPQNVGGSGISTTQNSHHLAKLSSHMVNNNDWGAATYLSASKYGAGYDKVQINSSAAKHTGYGETYSITGCGPWENGNTDSYGNSNDSDIDHKGISVGTLGTQSACSSDNPQRAYNGTLGKLASTTNNPTGIYDMAGGGYEYVAASYSDNLNNSNTNYFDSAAHPPYVNTYNFKDFNFCTYQTCGGQALYETHNGSSSVGNNMWLNQTAYFVEQDSFSYPWSSRGGGWGYGLSAGLFDVDRIFGYADSSYYNGTDAFRVALAPTV